jgi:hypothetical protein
MQMALLLKPLLPRANTWTFARVEPSQALARRCAARHAGSLTQHCCCCRRRHLSGLDFFKPMQPPGVVVSFSDLRPLGRPCVRGLHSLLELARLSRVGIDFGSTRSHRTVQIWRFLTAA